MYIYTLRIGCACAMRYLPHCDYVKTSVCRTLVCYFLHQNTTNPANNHFLIRARILASPDFVSSHWSLDAARLFEWQCT